MKASFAFVQNQRFPNEYAFGIYTVKTCEAAQQLGYRTYLVHPIRAQTNPILNTSIWEYYHIKQNSFQIKAVNVPEFLSIPVFLEAIIKHFRQLMMTIFFVTHSIFYLSSNKISVIQTTSRELIVLLKVFFWYKPFVIYDVHVEPRTIYEKLLDYLMLSRINLFNVNSYFYQEFYHQKGIDNSRFLTLPSGFDPVVFSPIKNGKKIRDQLGIARDRFVIGFAGRFETFGNEKGIEEMISAAAQLRSVIPITVLAIGGPDLLVEKYKKLAYDFGLTSQEIIIKSQIKPGEVPNYLAAFDVACLLYPDTYHYRDKMSPQKAVEYMAMKKPIIASDLPSIKNLLTSDEAYFINPGNQKELESTILKIFQNYPNAIKKAELAFKKVQKYSWKQRQKKLFSKLMDVFYVPTS